MTTKPNIYLAGKIRHYCWRNSLVDGLHNQHWDDGVLPQALFNYVGPFFVSCDHGCFHNTNSHGAIARKADSLCPGRGELAEFDFPHHEIAALCLGAIDKANLVFCYIDSADCHGTLVEIGYAHARNIPVVITFAPGIATAQSNDFWFACAKALWVVFDVAERTLPGYLVKAIRRYT
jgi:hypothetical protein